MCLGSETEWVRLLLSRLMALVYGIRHLQSWEGAMHEGGYPRVRRGAACPQARVKGDAQEHAVNIPYS